MKRLALFLSFSVGLLSLSQEILWVRLVSFGQQGAPQAFALVLSAFLLGISIGAILGRQLCQRSPHLLRSAAWVLAQAAFVDLACLLLASRVLDATDPARLPALALLIALTAALKGALFPIVHHLGSDAHAEQRIGRSVSRVYLANVIGSSLGPLLTGFYLLDRVSVESAFALVGLATAALSLLCIARERITASALVPLGIFALAALAFLQPPELLAKIAEVRESRDEIRHLIQNKHGAIHVIRSEYGDVTYGGNAYDGVISNDMLSNANMLDRAYLMATLHPAPKRVLVIGLSSGAWTRAILGMPGVERVDVVELNAGYVELIRRYPAMAPLLDDPRLHLHIDDGRRWLRRHGDQRYDLIFQNTTFHWRAYTTMLLSREYLALAQRVMAPGAILALNTTGSADAYATGLALFPHVLRYRNFAYMSHAPFVKRADAEAVLRACRIGTEPAFPEALFKPGAIAERLAHAALESAADYLRTQPAGAELITDFNLVPEFRHGLRPFGGLLDPLLPPH